MEKEIFIRYFTYLLSFQSYQIVNVLRNKYGKDKVDSTVYYDNFKKYIKSVLLETKATLFFNYMKDYIIRDSPNAIRRFYPECTSVEIDSNDIDTLRMTYDDAALIDFLMDYRKEFKEGFYTLVIYFCHYLRWLFSSYDSRYNYCSELEVGLGEGCNKYISPMTYIMYDKIDIVQNEDERIRTTVYDYIIAVPTMLGMIGAKDFATYTNQTGILGTKMTFTKDQLMSGYIHSHRETGHGFSLRPRPHCTGGDNPINAVVLQIRQRQRQHPWQVISRMEVLNFAENLYVYLGVESIQGGPWIKIQNMSGGHNVCISETTRWSDTYNPNSIWDSSWREKMQMIARDMFLMNKNKYHFVKFSISTTGISFAQCVKDLAISFTNLLYILLKDNTTYPSFRDLTFEASIQEQIYEMSGRDFSYKEEIKDCYFTICGNKYTYKMIDDENEINYARIVTIDLFMYLLQYFKQSFYSLIKS